MNTATVVGRVGRDAEVRYFESGKVKAQFSLAVNRWDSKTKSEVTDWFNIDVWVNRQNLPENILKKACRLLLMAELAKTSGLIKQQATKENLSL